MSLSKTITLLHGNCFSPQRQVWGNKPLTHYRRFRQGQQYHRPQETAFSHARTRRRGRRVCKQRLTRRVDGSSQRSRAGPLFQRLGRGHLITFVSFAGCGCCCSC